MIPLHDDNPRQLTPWVTRAAVGVCVLVYLWQLTLPDARAEQALAYGFGVIPAVLFGHAELPAALDMLPAWATLVTSIFLHGGIIHLIGNMLFLWVFGDNVEDAMGHGRFVVFFLVTGVAAGLSHALADPASQVPLVGASGAISGVLGAYILLYPKARVLVGLPVLFILIPIRLPALLVIGVWFGLQFVNVISSGAGSNVAWFAHIGGFIAGVVLIPLFKDRNHRFFTDGVDTYAGPFASKAAMKIVRPEPRQDDDGRRRRRGPWG